MNSPIAILLVDDDEEDYLIIRDIFEDIDHQRYTLDWVDTYDRALEIMSQNLHEVFLIDYRLGSLHNGLELIEMAIKSGVDGPLILLTGQGDIEIDEKAMQAGASDYLIKSKLESTTLERSIRYGLQQTNHVKEMRRFNQELEQRVAARTEALTMAINDLEKQIKETREAEAALRVSQVELRKALAKEQELNELKSRFVSMASHEFRTPLATILSSISLIDKYHDPSFFEKRVRHINRIKSNVQHLTNILNDFLSLSKLEEGVISINPTHFNLREFGEEVTEEMQTQAKKGQVIHYQHEGTHSKVNLDPRILKNIAANLLSNAIKYTSEDKDIFFTTHINAEKITMQVIDPGLGIPLEEQNHLFTRFFRAHNVTNIPGTGLGLSIVKRYIELMDGQIDFVSVPGKGTTFTVNFPQNT